MFRRNEKLKGVDKLFKEVQFRVVCCLIRQLFRSWIFIYFLYESDNLRLIQVLNLGIKVDYSKSKLLGW